MIPPICVLFQSSFLAMVVLESWISNVGLPMASAIPNGTSDGPIARTMIFFIEAGGPWTMNPSIKMLSPVRTGRRVEMLVTSPGLAVGLALGVALAVAVAVGVGAGSLSVIVPTPW